MSEAKVLLSVLLLISLCASLSAREFKCTPGICGLGEFFNCTTGKCNRCHEGEFMDRKNHSYASCFVCTKPGEGQGIKSKCTPEKDAELYCTENGYFLAGPSDDHHGQWCDKCRQCDSGHYVVSPCSETQNTICSQSPPSTEQSPVSSIKTTPQPPVIIRTTPQPPVISIKSTTWPLSASVTATPQLPDGSNMSTTASMEEKCSGPSLDVIAVIVIVIFILFAFCICLFCSLLPCQKSNGCPQQNSIENGIYYDRNNTKIVGISYTPMQIRIQNDI